MSDVRKASIRDVGEIVRIHLEAFPNFFLSSLGARFLARFYGALVQDQDAICLVASERELDGFIVGPVHPEHFYRRLLLRQGFGFAMDALPAALSRPFVTTRRLLAALVFRGDLPKARQSAALVSSLATRPACQGRGTASLLLRTFCMAAAARGVHYVYLTTDRDENAEVNRFYAKNGFKIESELLRKNGRVMNRYVCAIDASAGSDDNTNHGEGMHVQ